MTTRFPRPLLYFFYRLLRLRRSFRGDVGTPFMDCSAIVALSVAANAIVSLKLMEKAFSVDPWWIIDSLPHTQERLVLFVIWLVLFAAVYFYVTAPRQIRIMVEIYDTESEASKRRGTVSCIAYIVVSIVVMLTVVFFFSP